MDSMKRIALCLSLCLGLLATGCYRPAERTITVAVPQMKSQDCANRITEVFRIGRPDKVDGIVAVVPNVAAKTVDVTFESLKLSIKNVEFAIASAGFDANDIPANAEARAKLPVDCR